MPPLQHERPPVAPTDRADAPLPILQAGGFSACVDAYVWEPDPQRGTGLMRLWFVSLLGPQQALRALWARLVRGETATLSRELLGVTRLCALAPEGPKQWRSWTASLPGAAGHQLVLLPEAARHTHPRGDFLLLPRSREEAAALHFRFLDRRVDLPLHAGWADWLWERALRTTEAAPLEAEGIHAFRCAPRPERLAEDLTAAVRDGRLRTSPSTGQGAA